MKTEVGELLRKAWKMSGSTPCRHFKLSRERTARGDHTGALLCCAGGLTLRRGRQGDTRASGLTLLRQTNGFAVYNCVTTVLH
jgi:hypothetical protein